MKRTLSALAVLVGVSSLLVLMGYQQSTRGKNAGEPSVVIPEIKIEPERPLRSPVPSPRAPDEETNPSARITIYAARWTDTDVELVPVTKPVEAATPLAALQALCRYRGSAELDSPIPRGVRVLGLDIDPNGTATADFSREIIDHFPGGSSSEQMLVGSIVNTLTRFPAIRSVVITVAGKPVESIGGHIELSEPMKRDPSLIAKRGTETGR